MYKQIPVNRIDFTQIEWEVAMSGLRQKTVDYVGKRIRLAEFSYGFMEEEWCLEQHLGYVVEGSISIQFEEDLIEFHKGHGIVIEANNKHKAVIKSGQRAILVLFEEAV